MRVATSILVRAGCATKCDIHEEVSDNLGDMEDAYKLVNSLITKSDPIVAQFNGDRRRATDAIKAAKANLGMECGSCAKNRDED